MLSNTTLITKEDIQLAYQKLKTYAYYDSTELFMRQRIVEFETDLFKENDRPGKKKIKSFYTDNSIESLFKKDANEITIEDKFNYLVMQLNSNATKLSEYFESLIEAIEIKYLPKKIEEKENKDENFITNKLSDDTYPVSQVNAFIDMPVELHIISILWIMKSGYKFDAELLNESRGNRLVLQKGSKKTIENSSLFKPYHHQYQKWRDDAIIAAEHLLDQDKDVVLLNLDITRFFYSSTINLDVYFKKEDGLVGKILKKIYENHVENVVSKLGFKRPEDGSSFLPIGDLSAYIIANHYLNDFDRTIMDKYRPVYYGRYVDDMLLVFQGKLNSNKNDESKKDNPFQLNLEKYKKTHEIESDHFKFTKVEEYIAETLEPLLVVTPDEEKKESNKNKITIKHHEKYKNLVFQSEKTLLYEFLHGESTLTIDKLKQELIERSSEFRDLPEDNEDEKSLEKAAHHLIYSDSEGKVRTLKDYKINRYGLSIYMTNKILATINYKQSVDVEEVKKLLKLIKGKNIIIFYKLWEKILTFLLVNNHQRYYIQFYFDTLKAIENLTFQKEDSSDLTYDLQSSLIAHLEIAHELSLSLNPNFLTKIKKIYEEFKFNKKETHLWVFNTDITDAKSSWITRFRSTNMMRHHYVAIPLLNYTNINNDITINLSSQAVSLENYKINEERFKYSPRKLNFWEIALAHQIQELYEKKVENCNDEISFDINVTLKNIYDLYTNANKNHQTQYQLKNKNPKELFYSIDKKAEDDLLIQINSGNEEQLQTPKIGIANTKISGSNIVSSLKLEPNVSKERYDELIDFLKDTRKLNADIIVFPECFIPFHFAQSLAQYAKKNQSLIISGLEHYVIGDYAYNFVLTLIPIERDGYKDVVPIFRLKNHYSPKEIEIIHQFGKKVPIPKPNQYQLINWRNIYFSTFYCFEVADISHRSAMRSKVDLLFMIEYNKDVNYFSNIVESVIRDIHCYAVQCNSSHFGDSRISQPTKSVQVDIVNLKGGENNVTVIGKVDIKELRDFQLWNTQPSYKTFKPLPPDFDRSMVKKKIKNLNLL